MQGVETSKKLGLQPRCILRKEKSAIKGDPEKGWSGIETKRELKKKRWS